MIDVEKNYEILDAELFAVVESFCHWRHYLEQPYHTVDEVTNHSNLHAFIMSYQLKRKQIQ